jgi:hypothetical protein
LDYAWPLVPFNRQHPVRGNFGDPRTISDEPFGVDDIGDPGDYSFHNGVDISARVGAAVYPVVSGTAIVRDGDQVIVRARSPKRSFLYIHIVPAVRTGDHVVGERTVLGRVRFPARHLHLTEIDNGHVTNPALHLRPYQDHTTPTVRSVRFFDAAGRAMNPLALHGTVWIVARAWDTPPLPVPGAWAGFPVGPALLRWKITTTKGRALTAVKAPVDFHTTEPPLRDFWLEYASGTYQNFPVFDHHYYWGHAGRFRYRLGQLDTDTLKPGRYEIAVSASDICGNTATLTQPIRLAGTEHQPVGQANLETSITIADRHSKHPAA